MLRTLRLPPMLNLLYDYDENGVLRKRKKSTNNTMNNLDDAIIISENNLSIFWNVSRNESIDIEDLLEIQELMAGNHLKIGVYTP